MKRPTLSLVILIAALLPAACQPLAPRPQRPAPTPTVESPDALAIALREFDSDFRGAIDSAASQANALDLTRSQRKAATTWRVQAGTLLRHAFNQDDSREILLDVWSLCRRMEDYFDAGPGAAEFGPARSLALATARDLLARCETLAQAHVLPETLEQVRAEVAAYARSNALQPGFVAPAGQDLSDISPGQQVLKWILDVPLAPLHGVQKMNQTSDSLRDMSRTAERFTDVVDDLPATSRREALLLAEDLERLPSVAATTQSVQRIAAGTERFTQVVEDLPQRTREETEQLLNRVDDSLPQVRTTLAELQKTTDAIRAATADLRNLIEPLDRTLASFTEAGRAWSGTADAVGAASRELIPLFRPTAQTPPAPAQPPSAPTPKPASPAQPSDATAQPSMTPVHPSEARAQPPIAPAQPSEAPAQSFTARAPTNGATVQPSAPAAPPDTATTPPAAVPPPDAPTTQASFRFEDVTASAEALTRTTVELRALLADLQRFLASGGASAEASKLTAPADQVLERAGLTSRTLIDHAAWRAAQLLVLLAVLLLGYRWLTREKRFQEPFSSRGRPP